MSRSIPLRHENSALTLPVQISLTSTLKFWLATVTSAILIQLVFLTSAYSQQIPKFSSTLPPIFYVSKNGPTDGTADGLSWTTAWPEMDKINWQTIQAASNASAAQFPNGINYHGAVPGDNVICAILIDGGPTGSHMEYDTPLNAGPFVSPINPYGAYTVIRAANDPLDPANINPSQHSGQIIINGAKFTGEEAGCPGIDITHAGGIYIWGGPVWGGCFVNQNGAAEQGWAVINCPVGLYNGGNGGFAWVSGMMFANNGVNVMVAGYQDLPFKTIAGQTLKVDQSPPANPFGYGDAGLHLLTTWIQNATDTNYRANVWIANSSNGNGPPVPAGPVTGELDQDGYPQLNSCLICQTQNPGQFDGVVYNNAIDQTYFGNSWFQYFSSLIGPGLRDGIVVNQVSGCVDVIEPYL